jgi:rhodanese-related sulfurtransferase
VDKRLAIPLVALVGLGVAALLMPSGGGGQTITPEETLRRMQARDTSIVVLDVRTPQEFESSAGHLEGALLIPVQELDGRMGELEPFRGKTIVVYCRTVNRSGQAAALLRGKGHSALMMSGGISEWNRLQYPVKRAGAE